MRKVSVNWPAFTLALLVGCLVNYLGDWLIGVRIELFWGLQTFNFLWFLQLFIWPVVVGIAVSFVYGLGGKWIAPLAPLIIRWLAYIETQNVLGVPDGAHLMPLGWWGFFVILAMETAMIGGVTGEIVNKRVYGRSKPGEEGGVRVESTAAQPVTTATTDKPSVLPEKLREEIAESPKDRDAGE
jgi:hypothetical protein